MTASLKRVLDIEAALHWAYRDELPKSFTERGGGEGEPRSVHPMWRSVAFGGPVDNWSREPGFPLAMGETHPDAVLVASAVDMLDPAAIDITGYARRASGLGGDPADLDVDIIAVAAIERAAATVVGCATIGKRPDHGPVPSITTRKGPNGQPMVFVRVPETREINGTAYTVPVERPVNRHGKRAAALPSGAYSKIVYEPGRVAVYTERAEYAAWRAALVILAERLAGKLASIEVRPPAAAKRPWDGELDEGRTGTTHRDPRYAGFVRTPARPVALAPLPRSKHGPVRHIPVSAA